MKAVRRELRKKWLGDRLLKVKTLKDQEAESFDARTLVLTDLPKNIRNDELLNAASALGAVTHLELPVVDRYVRDKLDLIGRSETSQDLAKRKEQEYRLAKKLMSETSQAE